MVSAIKSCTDALVRQRAELLARERREEADMARFVTGAALGADARDGDAELTSDLERCASQPSGAKMTHIAGSARAPSERRDESDAALSAKASAGPAHLLDDPRLDAELAKAVGAEETVAVRAIDSPQAYPTGPPPTMRTVGSAVWPFA